MDEKQIHWYPGHMNKSIREIKELSKKIDCFFLILDARAPSSSFLSLFNEIVGNKELIIILNKADLVKKNDLNKWIEYYKKNYKYIFSLSANNKKIMNKRILDILNNIKFKSLIPKFVILGVPNVGKSTFLNNLINKKKADVQNKPGITKRINWYQFDKNYWILDTPGVLEPKFELEKDKIILASIGSFKYENLPIEKVVINLLEILFEKNKNVSKYFNFLNLEEDLLNKINNSKVTEFDFYKRILLEYQIGKYGKIILDDLEKK
ncbi:MAG: ribosome biogenesis GTPase A [Candidatus Hepatoplasma vulgare]|nr:MAG: ribosome biogenesis GTPase A [Candidatus Hepatoplasma sp.]